MTATKTITGLHPTTVAGVAAKKILTNRLAAVTQRLKPARDQFHDNDEHVHQLRVASRRADAAIRMFDEYLPGKRVEQARNALRRLRRTAGPARDWDVFRTRIVETNPTDPLKYFLLGIITYHRHAVQKPLGNAVTAAMTDWPKLVKSLLSEIDSKTKSHFTEVIENRVNTLVKRISRHLAAVTPATPIIELHRLRILGKRLRYTLELATFEQEHPKMLGALETLQDILGEWHDAYAAKTHLMEAKAAAASANGALHSSTMSGLTALIRRFEKQETKQSQLFKRWLAGWNTKMKANG